MVTANRIAQKIIMRFSVIDFITRAKEKHGTRFDYSKVIYHNARTKVIIGCPVHGDFFMTPDSHLRGCICPKCWGKYKTTEEFIREAETIHGFRYDYNKTIYCNSRQKVIVVCREHGEFLISSLCHISRKHGCPKCGGSEKLTRDDYIIRVKKIHGDKYNYDHVQYKNMHTKITVVCNLHGEFLISPNHHLHGKGCRKCAIKQRGDACRYTTEIFIQKAIAKHGHRYDYSQTIYYNTSEKVSIICKLHGKFLTNPNSHLCGCGCPACKSSHGEARITRFLKENNIRYVPQYRFKACRDKQPLPFDFIIHYRGKKYAIEYNGQQHYDPISLYAITRQTTVKMDKVDVFFALQKRDKIKREWCKQNHIPLLVIPYYKQLQIETLIIKFIGYNPSIIDYEQETF